ncbi:hypothetical protein ACFWJF_11750, partial [Streptomyces yangpuensis]
MPQDVEFHLPFPVRCSPDPEGARRRNLQWVRRVGPVEEGRPPDWYASWDMPRPAALGLPCARGAMLDLCADAMAFFFVSDDQFDGNPGRDPARAATVCRRMTDIVHGADPDGEADACSVALADIRDARHPWRASRPGGAGGARKGGELRGPGPRGGGAP